MSGRASDLWMPLYVGDYLAATTRLTTEQHGAYLLLLIDYWRNGAPPDDDVVLAQIAKLPVPAWRKARKALIGFFTIEDGHLVQRRAERERERASTITEKRSNAGKEGAAKRWQTGKQTHGEVMANAMANGQQTGKQIDAQSQSQVPLEHKGSNGRVEPDADQIFWESGKAFIQPEAKGDPGALIGKWCRDYGKEATAQAITRAQLERPAQRIPFIVGCLKRERQEGGLSVPC